MAGERLRQRLQRWQRRALALVVLAAFLAAPPAAAAAQAAEPVTLADWLRSIFVTPDRKTDPSSPALAVQTPAPPPPVLQTSSQPAPPKQAPAPERLPEAWVRRASSRPGRRRRHRRPRA